MTRHLETLRYAFLLAPAITALISNPASADPPVITVDENFSGQSIGAEIEFWEDKTGDAGIEEAVAASDAFSRSENSVPNFGYTDSAYWFRFDLSNESKSQTEVILEAGYPLIDSLTSCFKTSSQSDWTCTVSGDAVPFSQRELPFRNVTFSYTLDPEQRKTVYLRVKTTSSLRIPLWLWPSFDFQGHIISDEIAFGFLFGWLIVLLLYNFLLGIITRDGLYFHYSFFLTSCILFTSSMTGHAFQFLWPGSPGWASRSIPIFVCFWAITADVFTRFFLNTKKRTPRMDKSLLVLLVVYSASMAASFVGPISLTTRISLVFVFIGSFFFLSEALFVWKIGYKPARFFALGWLSFASMSIVAVLRSFGMIPEGFISEQCLNLGAGTLALLFGFATGDLLRALITERQQSREAQLALAAERFHNFSEIKKIADYVSSVSSGVSQATSKLVSSGDAVSSAVADVSGFAGDLSDMVKSIKISTHRITTAARENMSVAKDTTAAMENTKREVSLVKNDSELIFETSQQLITSLNDLDNIVRSVGSIAEQSKILAVNASIESAAAGEYGTGFSVIAQEVKNLAQESKEATVEIDDMLGVFKESIFDIIQMTRSSVQKTEDSQRSIQHVLDLSLVLKTAIDENVTMAEEISTNLQNRADSLSHIIKEVARIEGAVKDNQSVGVKITSAAENLDSTVNNLLGLVGDGPQVAS